MRRKNDLPELLAPAGSYDALVAAINAGADAVYFGTTLFNARMNAKNISFEELPKALDYVHVHGKKAYVTLNTLLYDREIPSFLDAARRLYDMGVDAAIVADTGAMALLREYLPDFEIHASTQFSAHSKDGADAAAALGCKRCVLARELSKENIEYATDNSKCEIEIFLHGALCVSHSGQCLFSSLVGGRSGNRGECAQACRLPYNNSYPLSLKDLSLSAHIPELIDSGVASLKIEGRMKSPSYVYGVTNIYRTLLDERRSANKEEERRLSDLFSRDGFTDGYYANSIKKKMTGVRTEESKSTSRALDIADITEHKINIGARVKITEDEATLTLISPIGEASYTSPVKPQKAQNAPLTEEGLSERLRKTGATLFVIPEDKIEITLERGLNMSPGDVNALRRECIARLYGKYTKKHSTPALNVTLPTPKTEAKCTALFLYPHQFDSAEPGFFDLSFLPLFDFDKASRLPEGVYLPPVISDTEKEEVRVKLFAARSAGVEWALCATLAHFELAKEANLKIFGDFRLNLTNRESAETVKKYGAEDFVLSPELSLPALRDIGCGSSIVYGRIPLMLLERCFARENGGCDRCGKINLCDRRGVNFPLVREWKHRNLLLNSVVTYMGDRQKDLRDYKVKGYHFIFTKESEKEVREVISDFKKQKERKDVRRIKC